jgi:hypothetical protein
MFPFQNKPTKEQSLPSPGSRGARHMALRALSAEEWVSRLWEGPACSHLLNASFFTLSRILIVAQATEKGRGDWMRHKAWFCGRRNVPILTLTVTCATAIRPCGREKEGGRQRCKERGKEVREREAVMQVAVNLCVGSWSQFLSNDILTFPASLTDAYENSHHEITHSGWKLCFQEPLGLQNQCLVRRILILFFKSPKMKGVENPGRACGISLALLVWLTLLWAPVTWHTAE